MPYDLSSLDRGTLTLERSRLSLRHQKDVEKGLCLDMSRGKPDTPQLDLSDPMLTVLSRGGDCRTAEGFDCRNYGLAGGVPEAVALFSSLLDVKEEELLLGGNSSLTLMYDTVCRAMLFGTEKGGAPWKDAGSIKFLAPVPGYDRHFAICEALGIGLIPLPLTGSGPDMDLAEELVAGDPSIKGMWCVPKYSNPSGETYDEKTVRRIAALTPAASDFRVFWDLAYLLHDLYEEGDRLLNIFDLTRGTKNENMVLGFFSTSKLTYAGGGVAMLLASPENIRRAKEQIAYQTISPDKLNMLRHARFLKDGENIRALMRRHAAILRPKFEAVHRVFREEAGDTPYLRLTEPKGGYFLMLTLPCGTAKRTVALCREAGVILTPAGATHPYHTDPDDRYIRIAPSCLSVSELTEASRVLVTAASLATAEKLLSEG